MAVFLSLIHGRCAQAEFLTVIDSPPSEFDRHGRIESNTQINLYPGGMLPGRYNIGPSRETGDNIEINLLGGSIGDEQTSFGGLRTSSGWSQTTNVTVNLIDGNVWGNLEAVSAALINMNGGTIHGSMDVEEGSLAVVNGGLITRELTAKGGSSVRMTGGVVGWGQSAFLEGVVVHDGSTFFMSGGDVRGAVTVSNSYASITGGSVSGRVNANSSGEIEIAGGALGPIQAYTSASVTLIGDEFLLDGTPVNGLGANAQTVEFPDDSLLTGVLSDGVPVILSNRGILKDSFADHQIQLRLEPVPVAEPMAFDSATDVAPAGLRQGQSLTLRPDTQASSNFAALPGSSIAIVGGEVGRSFEAAGAEVTMTSGRIGELSTIYRGTVLRMSGGAIDSNFEVAAGARLELSGGTVGEVFSAHPESEVLYSGGKFAGSVGAESGSSFTISGGDFRVDGAAVGDLATPGSELQLDLPESSVLSGVLSDGTPFAFGGRDGWFMPGTLTLKATDLPRAGASVIHVPSDPVPEGLRSGQTLLLRNGGELGEHFTADWGSTVRMSGGRIGYRFKAVGSFVNITGGEVVSLNALFGSVVNLDGGVIDYHVSVDRGAILNVASGGVTGGLYVRDGGRARMTGGHLGRYNYVYGGSLDIKGGVVDGDINLYEDSMLTLEGGETRGEISAWSGAQLRIRGGRLADGLLVSEGSRATIVGSDFRIDGQPLDTSLTSLTTVDMSSGAVLSGVLSDGTPFAFASSDGDYIAQDTLRITSGGYFITPPTVTLPTFEYIPPKGLRPGNELTLETGEYVGQNFTAGWGSQLTVSGGEVGDNFEAVGVEVRLDEGTIGEGMDLFFGSSLSVAGGSIGEGLQAHRGSVVNLSGGTVPEIEARAGSVVTISGGLFGSWDDQYDVGRIHLESGSVLEVIGTDFLINGQPIEGIEEDESFVIEWDERPYSYYSISALLADGTPFEASIETNPLSSDSRRYWNFDGPSTIRLTSATASAAVPAPPTLPFLIAALLYPFRRREDFKLA